LAKLEALGIPPEGAKAVSQVRDGNRELLDRVIRRAEELRREWLQQDTEPFVGNARYVPAVSPEEEDIVRSSLEERVLEALALADGPLRKADIIARAGLTEATWFVTIANLRRRGLVIQEGTRRGASYRLP
jgi:hypothetical protein